MAGTVSAMFDTRDQAQRAVEELREAGVSDSALSVVARGARGAEVREVTDGVVSDDDDHTNVVRGILGGGALGAGLAVAALAIPGVGPLVAAGAIAASAVPGAMAIGAAAGAAAGTLNEALKSHGVSDEDAAYYDERMRDGEGALVTVRDEAGSDMSAVEAILHRNGGHSASRARAATMG